MNPLTHFLAAYFLTNLTIGNASQYILLIVFSATFIDLDHIPYIVKNFRDLREKKFGSEGRTRFHELYGMTLFSLLLSVIYIFYPIIEIKIVMVGVVSHYFIDLVSGYARPLYPYSEKEIFLNLIHDRFRVPVEVVITMFLGWYLWMTL